MSRDPSAPGDSRDESTNNARDDEGGSGNRSEFDDGPNTRSADVPEPVANRRQPRTSPHEAGRQARERFDDQPETDEELRARQEREREEAMRAYEEDGRADELREEYRDYERSPEQWAKESEQNTTRQGTQQQSSVRDGPTGHESPQRREHDRSPSETERRQQRAHTARGGDSSDSQSQPQPQPPHSDDRPDEDLSDEQILQRTIEDRKRTRSAELRTPHGSVGVTIKKGDQSSSWDFLDAYQAWMERQLDDDPDEDDELQAELRAELDPYRDENGDVDLSSDEIPEDVRQRVRDLTEERARETRIRADGDAITAAKEYLLYGREKNGAYESLLAGSKVPDHLVTGAIRSNQVPVYGLLGLAAEAVNFSLEYDLDPSFR